MAFIEQPFFVDCLQCPPNGFNVIIGIGNIGMLHVRPITDGIAHLFPFAFIFPNRLLAFVNKRKHAVTLDLLLAVQSEQLFHFKFNGKSVRIPTRFAQHVKAFHRAVAGNDILLQALPGAYEAYLRLRLQLFYLVRNGQGRINVSARTAAGKNYLHLTLPPSSSCTSFLK